MASSAAAGGANRLPVWLAGLVPLAVIGILAGLFLAFNPIGSLRDVPPVEAVAVERMVFTEEGIELKLRNDGPDDVSIAQVQVNESYWAFSMEDNTVGRLGSTEMTIPYPWDEGLPIRIEVVTS